MTPTTLQMLDATGRVLKTTALDVAHQHARQWRVTPVNGRVPEGAVRGLVLDEHGKVVAETDLE